MPIRLLQEYRAVSHGSQPQPPDHAVALPTRIGVRPLLPLRDVQVQAEQVTGRQSPFQRITVFPGGMTKHIIHWEQNRNFTDRCLHPRLKLEFSYAPESPDSWLCVSEGAVEPVLVDSKSRFKGQSLRGGYRLTLTTDDREYVSEPVPLLTHLSFTEYRLALRILRAENRMLYSHTPGILLKRRWLGTICPECVDKLTAVSKRDACPMCYGTGFTDGYYAPSPCKMLINTPGSNDKVEQAIGPTNIKSVSGRVPASFFPETNDVWVNTLTGERWRIDSYNTVVALRTLPLILQCSLKSIPASDAVYQKTL